MTWSFWAFRVEQRTLLDGIDRKFTTSEQRIVEKLEEHRKEQYTRHYDTLQTIRLEATDTRELVKDWCPASAAVPLLGRGGYSTSAR